MPLPIISTTLTVVQGATLTRTLQGSNLDGSTPINWTSGATLTGTVWLAQNESTLITFTPTWFSASACQFTVSLAATQTASLSIDATYNLQVFGTQGGVEYCLGWVYLQILPAAGSQSSATPADLITGAYAAQMLQGLTLSSSQLEYIPTLVTAASAAVRSWCNRKFVQATYTEEVIVELDGSIRLAQIPINQIYRVQTNISSALTVSNTTATTAWAYATVTGDAWVGQTITGLTLNWESAGTTNTTAITFGANETISGLASAINAVGNGWSATADSVLGAWPVTEIMNLLIGQGCSINDLPYGYGQYNVYASNVTNYYFHPDGGQLTGIVFVGRQGANVFAEQWGGYDYGQANDPAPLKGKVKCTYNGGFVAVPPEIQLATLEIVKFMLERLATELLLKSETANQYTYEVALEMIEFLPRHSRQALNWYRITNA